MIHNYSYMAKKYVFDLLLERYGPNEEIVTRMTHYLASEKDVQKFCQLFVDAYSKGYEKAVADYRKKFEELGYNVQIVAERR